MSSVRGFRGSVERVREVCKRWDALTKGPSPTTQAIYDAIGDPESELPKDPPSGWYVFGTHAGWDTAPPMRFSEEVDEALMPLWEQPNYEADVWCKCEKPLFTFEPPLEDQINICRRCSMVIPASKLNA